MKTVFGHGKGRLGCVGREFFRLVRGGSGYFYRQQSADGLLSYCCLLLCFMYLRKTLEQTADYETDRPAVGTAVCMFFTTAVYERRYSAESTAALGMTAPTDEHKEPERG